VPSRRLPNIPGPGPRVRNSGIVPTYKYGDFLACEASALLFLPGSDTGGALAIVAAAAVRAVLKGGSALYPAAAVGANLIIALKVREACIQQVYGPGHY
jgi:hypothetical protein